MTLPKLSGLASITLALIYVLGFVYFGAFWQYPATGASEEKFAYLVQHQVAFTLVYLAIYVLFGVVLTVLVVGLNERLKVTGPLIQVASAFGVIWVGMVIASGMISTIGLDYVVRYGEDHLEGAMDVWRVIAVLTESIGGGNELLGGLWVLLVSIAALKTAALPSPLNYGGCFVGAAGIATVYPAEIFTVVFGLSQIVWFIWLGIALLTFEGRGQE